MRAALLADSAIIFDAYGRIGIGLDGDRLINAARHYAFRYRMQHIPAGLECELEMPGRIRAHASDFAPGCQPNCNRALIWPVWTGAIQALDRTDRSKKNLPCDSARWQDFVAGGARSAHPSHDRLPI